MLCGKQRFVNHTEVCCNVCRVVFYSWSIYERQ